MKQTHSGNKFVKGTQFGDFLAEPQWKLFYLRQFSHCMRMWAKWCRGVTFTNNLLKGFVFKHLSERVCFLKVFRHSCWRNPYFLYSVIPIGETHLHVSSIPPISLARYFACNEGTASNTAFFPTWCLCFFFSPATLVFFPFYIWCYLFNSCNGREQMFYE